MNTYLKIALLCVSLVAVGLLVLNLRTQTKVEHLKPLVIRIDDVGRAQAVQYDTLTYQPAGPGAGAEVLPHAVRDEALCADARDRQGALRGVPVLPRRRDRRCHDRPEPARRRRSRPSSPGASDEIEIQVKNVTLDELKSPPYKAAVDFDKVYYSFGQPAGERSARRSSRSSRLSCEDQIPNAMVLVNPLGLTITYFRVDQAFQ